MAITWFYGNTTSGKTTLSEAVTNTNDKQSPYYEAVRLDGDLMRGIWTDLDLSKEGRWEQNMRVARMAKMLDLQGFNVVVSVICPYRQLRREIRKIIDVKFIYIEGGKEGKEYPFEKP